MMAWDWETFGIEEPGYPVRVTNDVTGTEHTVIAGRTRAEIIENLLWGAARTTRQWLDDPAIEDAEPAGVCIYIKPDEIVMRFYSKGDDEAARQHLESLLAVFRAVAD